MAQKSAPQAVWRKVAEEEGLKITTEQDSKVKTVSREQFQMYKADSRKTQKIPLDLRDAYWALAITGKTVCLTDRKVKDKK